MFSLVGPAEANLFPVMLPQKLKQITGKKREIETLEDHTELPHKRYQASQDDDMVSFVLAEAKSQPGQH